MRRLINFTGGRGIASEDFEALQAQLDVLASAWRSLGPFVVSGCVITSSGGGYDMTEGYVCLNGKLIYVPAQSALNLGGSGLVLGETTAVAGFARPYDIAGNTQNGISTSTPTIVATGSAPAGEALKILPGGLRTMKEALADASIRAGLSRVEMYTGPTGSNFDGTGKGVGAWRGYYLANGQNGTPDLRNRFVVAAGDEYQVGDTGGAAEVTLTAAESGLPAHSHQVPRKGLGSGSTVGIDISSDISQLAFTSTETVVGQAAAEAHENRPPYYALAFVVYLGNADTYIVT